MPSIMSKVLDSYFARDCRNPMSTLYGMILASELFPKLKTMPYFSLFLGDIIPYLLRKM